MTLTLTADQLTDMQFDLGINSSEDVFTDAELNRLFNRANGVYFKAIVIALRALMVDASKWVNYTEGQTQEERSDRFKQVQDALTYYEEKVLLGQDQFAMVHIRSVPTPRRDRPFDRYPYRFGNSGGWGWRGGGGWY